MSLSNKLSIEDVDLKGKRVLIRVRNQRAAPNSFGYSLQLFCYQLSRLFAKHDGYQPWNTGAC
jgi:hypothetical protein